MKKLWLLIPLFGLFILAGCTQQTSVNSSTNTGVEVKGRIVEKMVAWTGEVKDQLLAIVAQHSWADSCFTMISGSVYDLTSRIGKHPGGDKAILASCGKESTEMFDAQHGMDPKKWEWLKSFEIKF